MKTKITDTPTGGDLATEIRRDKAALRSGRMALDRARVLDKLHCRELNDRKLDIEHASLQLEYAKARKEKPEIPFLK